jgi:polysaccharide biosynthesis/export protein
MGSGVVKHRSRHRWTVFGGAFALIAACSHPQAVPTPAQELHQQSAVQDLMRERTSDSAPVNYVIAPGDRVRVGVQQMNELSGELRVSEQGAITLALLGPVEIAGLTERQAAAKLQTALLDYVREPSVSVTVTEIHGRQVSVLGAVLKPGVYPIRGANLTVADMVTQAGGMTKDAGGIIYFSPADSSEDVAARQEAAAALHLDAKAPGLFADSKRSVAIDLTPLYQGRQVPDLLLPVRAGDMIVVATAGEVYVEGWVNNPGALKLTRGMTLTNAISGAGGMHFGAADSQVTLQRKGLGGETKTYVVDYASITTGSTPDVYLENGDHVDVASNPAKSVPWGMFTFVKSVFSFGVSGTVPTVGAK